MVFCRYRLSMCWRFVTSAPCLSFIMSKDRDHRLSRTKVISGSWFQDPWAQPLYAVDLGSDASFAQMSRGRP